MAALPGIRQQCFPVEGRVWTGMVSTPGSTSHSRARDNECVCTWILCAVCDRICRVVVESEGALYPVSLHRAAADLSMQSHIRLSLSPLYVCVCVGLFSVIASTCVCARASSIMYPPLHLLGNLAMNFADHNICMSPLSRPVNCVSQLWIVHIVCACLLLEKFSTDYSCHHMYQTYVYVYVLSVPNMLFLSFCFLG